MKRRTFLTHMATLMKSMLLMRLMPAAALASVPSGEDPELHYTPLNGDDLRELARRRVHHGAKRFRNPLGIPRDGRFGQLMRWKLFTGNAFKPHLEAQPLTTVTPDVAALARHKGLSVTLLRHAGLLIQDHGKVLLVDPVFDKIFWFIKDFSPLGIDPAQLPRPDHILITHGHYDHLDLPTLSRFDPATHLITPLGYAKEFNRIGMTHRHALDWFDTWRGDGLEIISLPCNHWTMRSPFEGPNTSLWGSYLIRTREGFTIYVSGDTAYFDGFEQIGRAWDIDLAIINLGAYEPRWFMAPSHMNPAETVQSFRELKARRLMIAHWGTFRLGDEPVHFPPLQIREEMTRQGMQDRLVELGLGETWFG